MSEVSGAFVTLEGERYYGIENVDCMAPFFISVVSDSDHWLFIASNGGLSAGRVSPETALFPYVTVDKIYDSCGHTGSKTLLRVDAGGTCSDWEPFNREHDHRYRLTRNLYKNLLGNKILFEEVNHDLQLTFRYSWASSDRYGFVRRSELENQGLAECTIEVLDGLLNLLPAGTPPYTQANSSYLVDAYKSSELHEATGLACFTLASGITDRAEPCESLKATTVFSLGLRQPRVLLSAGQLSAFRARQPLQPETRKRGVRGAYLINTTVQLTPGSTQDWQLIANIEQSQAETVRLIHELSDPDTVATELDRSVAQGSDALARIQAAADGFQLTGEETVSTHHYANVLFNVLRGGVFDNQYQVSAGHFTSHVQLFNKSVYAHHRTLLESLPAQLQSVELLASINQTGDPQLLRLCYEYLPITFGRRHGDPSRPWNHFAIELTDELGQRLLSYQGNWRDIFQNWEALLLSFPEFTESVIAKFVNASTADGYNPYRISNAGIDWEVEDDDDPWSYIGYWGDHQIIYLQKLLELSSQFHPSRLSELLRQPLFSYANVPYKIKPLADILSNAKSTVVYDEGLATQLRLRSEQLGADGKLLLNESGEVVQVTLLEKLLVPLLSKLGNLVIDGGIWLNTQRPEWNDANNALVGQGLSMVTLYYLRRYVTFFSEIIIGQPGQVQLSAEVSEWLLGTSDALQLACLGLNDDTVDAAQRHRWLLALGEAASRYRQQVYDQEGFSGTVSADLAGVKSLLDSALEVIDHSIRSNQRQDGLYHAYNLLELKSDALELHRLPAMLEGQVAVLSSGAIGPAQAVTLLQSLFESELLRLDQQTFLLYPDRQLPGFLEKNCVPAAAVETIPLLATMLANGDARIIECDPDGIYRFNAELTNTDALHAQLYRLAGSYGESLQAAREPLLQLYEQVFSHRSFTGRSGGMFGFEGLGSIYWHMVSKLLLAVADVFFLALDQGGDSQSARQLGELYYRVRKGLGFNKTPGEYGAFPTDPYSHTPGHAGAQQPGMTGMVKEEILARFGELGIRVRNGSVTFEPALLRACEFIAEPGVFRFLDTGGNWQELEVPSSALAFTWCQVPLVYRHDDSAQASLCVYWQDGGQQVFPEMTLPAEVAASLFQRSGAIERIELVLNSEQLFA